MTHRKSDPGPIDLQSALDRVKAQVAERATDSPQPDPAPPPRGLVPSLDLALRSALLARPGSYRRWVARRAIGLDDGALRLAVAREFAPSLRPATPETPAFTTRGGDRPALWLGGIDAADRLPDLAGDQLVAAARRVMSVPMPREGAGRA